MIENPEYSSGEVETGVLPNGKPWNGNMLIHGDNLLALKSLEQDYAGCVKCIYIDPPYNTGNAFTHYDDGVEHSLWLSLMRERLIILQNLLKNRRERYGFLSMRTRAIISKCFVMKFSDIRILWMKLFGNARILLSI